MEKRNRLLKTAIAILNWNGKKLLEEFLPSVVKHSTQADIYLIDNASTDDSLHFVENNFPQVKLIKNSANLGYAGGYNLGVKKILEQSDYDFFCFLNSDVEVTENWLNPIENLFRSEEHTSELQSRPHLVCRLLLEKKNYTTFIGSYPKATLKAEGKNDKNKSSED